MTPEDRDLALRKALNRARSSAKRRGREFDLTIDYLLYLWEEQGRRCAVSGIPFNNERYEESFVKTPFGPSLDRMDNAEGYIFGNIRLVTMVANFALNQWSDTVLTRLAQGVVQMERRDEKAWYEDQQQKLNNAELAANKMAGAMLENQNRIIAGLKASITKGPSRLRAAAAQAKRTRTGNN